MKDQTQDERFDARMRLWLRIYLVWPQDGEAQDAKAA